MNSNQIFEMALGLEKPWYVKEIKMDKAEGVLHGQIDIYLDFEKGFKFPAGKVHDTVSRTWQHLNFFQHTCFLHARVPRLVIGEGKVVDGKCSLGTPGKRLYTSF
jgi:hypothetical protein